MDLFQAVVLGIVQGLGEFLPISSSAHLVLVPWLFGWEDPGLTFDVALHFGTLVAIVAYFAKDWLEIAGMALGRNWFRRNMYGVKYRPDILWLLVLATVPGALIGYFLEHQAETVFRNPLLIAAALTIMGFLLYWADKRLKARKNLQRVGWGDALLIGLSQAFAIIPGVSRSGSTITTALFLGLDRVSAARFSFLMSTPIIFGACALKAKTFFTAGIHAPEIIGVIAAAVSGYIAIAGLLRFLGTTSYKIFFWYRAAVALVIVAVWLMR